MSVLSIITLIIVLASLVMLVLVYMKQRKKEDFRVSCTPCEKQYAQEVSGCLSDPSCVQKAKLNKLRCTSTCSMSALKINEDENAMACGQALSKGKSLSDFSPQFNDCVRDECDGTVNRTDPNSCAMNCCANVNNL